MNRTRVLSAATPLALAATITSGPVAAEAADRSDGFCVVDGRLVAAIGKDFVLRGVNHAHTWYADRAGQSLADIKALRLRSRRTGSGTTSVKPNPSSVAEVDGPGEPAGQRLVQRLAQARAAWFHGS
ncbi:hypothetical protein ACFQ8C_36785 [Streptomyces sp. NPDC056503]|uniref:hypothetical protein n=1 Tax=Streptomyces sp. NPDC056503 TaxID=3345842 RepID=UPI00367F7933